MSMTPEQLQAWRWEREIDERNRPLTDEELDAMFPEGYKVSMLFLLHLILQSKQSQHYIFTLLILDISTGLASPSGLRTNPHTSP